MGGATKKGFEWLMDQDCEIILKIDADYQMYPTDIPKILLPLSKKNVTQLKVIDLLI